MFLKFSTKSPLQSGALLSTLLILFLFLLGSYTGNKQNELIKNKQNGRPNILLIVADDLGYSDLGCYGGEIQTPRLDKLASNGIRMTSFYTTGRCCPSRASILTGLYPHRAGLGHMIRNLNQPGYTGKVSDDAITIAQILQHSGYRTFMSGKWHLGTNDPTKHGFEEYFGTLASAQTYWDPKHFIRKPDGSAVRTYKEGEFYGTNAITDYALNFLQKGRETPDKPWFLYLAYNSPHFPLQAPRSEIKKYAETYKAGWDKIREQRHKKMKDLGIIPKETVLTPRSKYWDWAESEPGVNPAWADMPGDRQQDLARRMAIFAAMVDVMDQNIGRVIADLEQKGELKAWEVPVHIIVQDQGGPMLPTRPGDCINILPTKEELVRLSSLIGRQD
jgi:arylsulfatase A-like enzyme